MFYGKVNGNAMSYFSQDYIQFFRDLEKNNNKEWFHAKKKRYEQSVKKTFEDFVGDMIASMQVHDSELEIEPKDCILRINRDIRFAKDKSPYNLHCTAFISSAGKKDKSIPGFFLRFSPEMIGIMGGCFGPSKDQLEKIRTAISQEGKKVRHLIDDASFVAKFECIQGDVYKRLPKAWQAVAEKESLIANKQFYYSCELPPETMLADDLIEQLMEYWQAMRPLNEYLKEVIQ